MLLGGLISVKMLTREKALRLASILYLLGGVVFGLPLTFCIQNALINLKLKERLVTHITTQLSSIICLLIAVLWLRLPFGSASIPVLSLLLAPFAFLLEINQFYSGFPLFALLLSPVLAVGLWQGTKRMLDLKVWSQPDPLSQLLWFLPYIFSVLLGVFSLTFFVLVMFQHWINNELPIYAVLLICFGSSLVLSVIAYYISYYFGVPSIKKWVFAQFQEIWQEYLPIEEERNFAARASMEQRGVFIQDIETSSTRSSIKARGDSNSLSRIRASEACGYPQLLIMTFLVMLDGGAMVAVIGGSIIKQISPLLLPGWPSGAEWGSCAVLSLSMAAGVLFLSKFTLDRFTPPFHSELTAPDALSMDIGILIPSLLSLIFGSPVGIIECKLAVLCSWMIMRQSHQRKETDKSTVARTGLVWLCGFVGTTAVSLALCFAVAKLLL